MAQWIGRSNALFVELLAGMSVSMDVRFEDLSTAFATESLSKWTDKSVAFQVLLAGDDAASVIALPNPLVQELVTRILGDQPDQLPIERDLTSLEMSVTEFAVETIVNSLQETWQSDSPLQLGLGNVESNLRRTKLFRPSEPIVICRSTMKTTLGESHWCWMMTNGFLARLFGVAAKPTRSADELPSQRHLEQLIRGMRAEVEVRLGAVQLTGPQLAKLRVGDVVVLDQRVTDPLLASIKGEPKFLGWAGRVGHRQGFEIESEVA